MIANETAYSYEDRAKIQRALGELRGLISRRFPAAEFFVTTGDDPEGVHLHAIVNIEDLDEVSEIVVSRLVDMQVDDGLPVYVFPRHPLDMGTVHAQGITAVSVAS